MAVAKSGGRKTGKVGKKGTGHLVNVVEKAGEGVLDDVRDVKKMYASKEFRAFIRNPTPEAIMANPEYVIVTAKLLLAINHPEGAILAAVVEHLVEASEEELLEASRKDCKSLGRELGEALDDDVSNSGYSSSDESPVDDIAAILARVRKHPQP